jgi:hypothetical protein
MKAGLESHLTCQNNAGYHYTAMLTNDQVYSSLHTCLESVDVTNLGIVTNVVITANKAAIKAQAFRLANNNCRWHYDSGAGDLGATNNVCAVGTAVEVGACTGVGVDVAVRNLIGHLPLGQPMVGGAGAYHMHPDPHNAGVLSQFAGDPTGCLANVLTSAITKNRATVQADCNYVLTNCPP